MNARKLVLGASAVTSFFAFAGISIGQAADPGATLFKQRCAACHSDVAGARSTVGPNLFGVVGRKAGATGFNYSPAMKGAKLVWNKATLDRYLTNPAQVVPGTRMVIRVPDAAQRAALIRYLEKRK